MIRVGREWVGSHLRDEVSTLPEEGVQSCISWERGVPRTCQKLHGGGIVAWTFLTFPYILFFRVYRQDSIETIVKFPWFLLYWSQEKAQNTAIQTTGVLKARLWACECHNVLMELRANV